MSIPFSRSIRSLAADGFRRSRVGMLIAVVLLTLWAAWFCLARVTLYEVTATARLEVKQAVYPIEAPVEGRVVATHLVLGQKVQAGDVLVELESDAQRLQPEEEQTRLAALTAQRDGIRQEIIAEKKVQDQERQVATVALAEARARHHEAEVAAQAVQKEADVYTQMRARGLTSQLDFLRVTAKARQHRAAADALRLAIDRLKGEQQTRESGGKLRLERLKGEATDLAGQIVEAKVAIERPEYEITRRLIRSPVAGRLGEVGLVQIGEVIHGGD